MKTISLTLALCVALTACEDKKPAAPDAAPSASASAAPPASTSAAAKPETPPDAITAQHVLVAYKGAKDAPKSVTRTKDEAKSRAEKVVRAGKAQADFAALVNEYSDDEGSKSRQGSLGKFTRDKMVKPFSDAAFALKVDEVSDIVETPYGFHVIKRNQ